MSRIQTRRNISVSATFFARLKAFAAARGMKHTTFVEERLRQMLKDWENGPAMSMQRHREDRQALARWADDGGSHV